MKVHFVAPKLVFCLLLLLQLLLEQLTPGKCEDSAGITCDSSGQCGNIELTNSEPREPCSCIDEGRYLRRTAKSNLYVALCNLSQQRATAPPRRRKAAHPPTSPMRSPLLPPPPPSPSSVWLKTKMSQIIMKQLLVIKSQTAVYPSTYSCCCCYCCCCCCDSCQFLGMENKHI